MALAAAVVLFHLACPIVIASQGSRFATTSFTQSSDIARYRAIARSEGTAYQDFEVEYPPLRELGGDIAHANAVAEGPILKGLRGRNQTPPVQVAAQAGVKAKNTEKK